MAALKLALITGITGQDGSYLSELLLEKGYIVHGLLRRSSSFNTHRLEHILDRLVLHYSDMTDASSLLQILTKLYDTYAGTCERFELYHLAAQSHVAVSFELPLYTGQVDALGTLNLLEAIRQTKWAFHAKFRMYNAATSELFGKVEEVPQRETSRFNPRSPYAAAKLYALSVCRNYRDAYGLFISNGILFNHTSPRRGENFVVRKITLGVAKIVTGKDDVLVLGNLDARRDIGHAKDYVEGMWRMLQHTTPDDFVLATGTSHTIREICTAAFKQVGIDLEWSADSTGHEVATDRASPAGRVLVRTDARYHRPTEVDLLCGDASKARAVLGWEPTQSLVSIVHEMVTHDLARVAGPQIVPGETL